MKERLETPGENKEWDFVLEQLEEAMIVEEEEEVVEDLEDAEPPWESQEPLSKKLEIYVEEGVQPPRHIIVGDLEEDALEEVDKQGDVERSCQEVEVTKEELKGVELVKPLEILPPKPLPSILSFKWSKREMVSGWHHKLKFTMVACSKCNCKVWCRARLLGSRRMFGHPKENSKVLPPKENLDDQLEDRVESGALCSVTVPVLCSALRYSLLLQHHHWAISASIPFQSLAIPLPIPFLLFITGQIDYMWMSDRGKGKAKDKEDQLLPSTILEKFLNLYCELHFPSYQQRKLNLEKKLAIPSDLRQSIELRLEGLSLAFTDRELVRVNESWVWEFYCNFFSPTLDSIHLRGGRILISDAAIEDALHCQPKTSDTVAYMQAAVEMHCMTYDYDALRDMVAGLDAPWVLDSDKTKPKGMLFEHLNWEARVWQQIFAHYVMPATHFSEILVDMSVAHFHSLLWSQRWLNGLVHPGYQMMSPHPQSTKRRDEFRGGLRWMRDQPRGDPEPAQRQQHLNSHLLHQLQHLDPHLPQQQHHPQLPVSPHHRHHQHLSRNTD
ncbi:uncharacterized protein DS421_16g544810 [Arachis hypogaea]|nr:uncharacterized protein DS421_16g544810 [Arachis hypogaea]